jgi:LPS O-antigen subunit length determinant protein (WzzB/FepE family)
MKKNNSYLADDEINLGDLIKSLWRKKILILSISIICGLSGYLYGSFQPQEFKSEIKLKNPHPLLFEAYNTIGNTNINANTNTNANAYNTMIFGQYTSDFKANFLSLDNLQTFLEESREFDNFKGHLKSRNISTKDYFKNKVGEVKVKNLIIPNQYFLVFTKELDGDIFLSNYALFIKKKIVFETKKILKLSIELQINSLENALESAKKIKLENPILRSMNPGNQVVNEPYDLFYKGTIVLSQEVISLKRLLIKLEADQFDFEFILDKPFKSPVNEMRNYEYIVAGLILGLFLSLVIISFPVLNNNK